MDKFNIEMPDDFEIDKQINFILDEGLKKKESFYSYIKNMYLEIGIKNLFHDLSELIFIGMLTIGILAFSLYIFSMGYEDSTNQIYTFIFVISPLFYLLTSVFSFINMKENNTYEIEMVCKYNLYQLSALRMLVFSVISILLNIILVCGLYKSIDVLKGIMISLTSVFLFSSILLYVILNIKGKISSYLWIGTWLLTNMILIKNANSQYIMLLENMPIVIYALILFISVYAYVKNIKLLSRYNKNLIRN